MNSQKLFDKLSEKMYKEIAEQEDEEILKKLKYIEDLGISFNEWLDVKAILKKELVQSTIDFFDLGPIGLTNDGYFILGETKTKGKITIKIILLNYRKTVK